MSSEQNKENSPENQERAERKATFSRRGLLQWSVPAILAVSLPPQVAMASGHGDAHRDHGDSHVDTHSDTHQDSHGDSHIDFAPRGSIGHGDSHVDFHGVGRRS
jgi:hypothetical protein